MQPTDSTHNRYANNVIWGATRTHSNRHHTHIPLANKKPGQHQIHFTSTRGMKEDKISPLRPWLGARHCRAIVSVNICNSPRLLPPTACETSIARVGGVMAPGRGAAT